MPAAYPNLVKVAGLEIGARAYPEPNEAQGVFGFDIRGAGLLPVQVVIDNKGNYPLEINPSQTFLVDQQNNFWPVLDKRLAYDRVAKSAQPAAIGSSAVSSGFLAGAAGALIGAAIGIATGQHVGNYALGGAAIGAAAGATVGGAQAIGDHPVYREIADDLRTKSLENRPVKPLELVNGFIFSRERPLPSRNFGCSSGRLAATATCPWPCPFIKSGEKVNWRTVTGRLDSGCSCRPGSFV